MLGKILLEFKTPSAYLDSIKVSASFIFACSLLLDRKEFEEVCEKIRKGAIKFSSIFPSGFLPKPIIHLSPELLELLEEDSEKKKEKRIGMKKTYKRVSFVPEDVVKKLLENEENSEEKYIEKIKEFLKKEEKQKILESEVRIRNSLKGEEGTKIFHLHLYKIFDACIYFSCEKGDMKLIKSSFRFLENTGLGQKVSSGLGEFKLISIKHESCKEYPRKLLLSKCLITNEDFQGFVQVDEINLRLRDGRVLPRIPVFLEGCVFETPPKGDYVETEDYLTSCYGIYYGGER